jgi:1-acyl-sn-glycerol-3-phosphate acyltransferase
VLTTILQHLFFALIVRPVVLVVIGLNVRYRERLPASGPAILVANHNSHLDAVVLMTLYRQRLLDSLRPVASAEYFSRFRWLAWFATHIMQVIPLDRRGRDVDRTLAGVYEALDRGKIVILFPEGSRGEPEKRGRFKRGIAHLARKYPDVPITPVFMHGLGKVLPKGEGLLVPCFCDVFVGEAMTGRDAGDDLMERVEASIQALSHEGHFPDWI